MKQRETHAISLDLKDAKLGNIANLFAEVSCRNVVADESLREKPVTVKLRDTPWRSALQTIADTNGFVIKESADAILLKPLP